MAAGKTHPSADPAVLAQFPKVIAAFAYGSAVFTQHGNANAKDNMLDLLLVVGDSFKWHEENLKMNRTHYSLMRVGGPKLISYVQDNFSANLYFNTLVPWNDRVIKYGVISEKWFIDDLVSWRSLYTSGRLQKPVKPLGSCPSHVCSALETNLTHAMRTSLLCLPDTFTDEQLFLQITNLSYAGDFRMTIGEHKDKVSNIVKPNIDNFRKIYLPLVHKDKFLKIQNNVIHQKFDAETRFQRLKSLPQDLKKYIIKWRMTGLRFQQFKHPSEQIQDALLYSLAHNQEETAKLALRGARSIVRYSSISQSLKGFLTTGMSKSVIYSGRKLGKMFRGMLK